MAKNGLTHSLQQKIDSGDHKVLRASRGMAQADVYLVQVNGINIVIKDFSQRPKLSKHFLCRPIVKRELRVLKALADTGLVPRIIGQISDDAFAIEFIDGVSPDRKNAGQWSQAYNQAQTFIELMHERGFAHNDFRRDNILILPDGRVRFFDFASAVRKPQRFKALLFVQYFLVSYMQSADLAGLIKMKTDLSGQALTKEEMALGQKPWPIKVLRDFWKKYINKPILHKLK